MVPRDYDRLISGYRLIQTALYWDTALFRPPYIEIPPYSDCLIRGPPLLLSVSPMKLQVNTVPAKSQRSWVQISPSAYSCVLVLVVSFSCEIFDERKARECEFAKIDESRRAQKTKKWECRTLCIYILGTSYILRAMRMKAKHLPHLLPPSAWPSLLSYILYIGSAFPLFSFLCASTSIDFCYYSRSRAFRSSNFSREKLSTSTSTHEYALGEN